jgi:surface antigen
MRLRLSLSLSLSLLGLMLGLLSACTTAGPGAGTGTGTGTGSIPSSPQRSTSGATQPLANGHPNTAELTAAGSTLALLDAPVAALAVPAGQTIAEMEERGQYDPAGQSTGAPEAQ